MVHYSIHKGSPPDPLFKESIQVWKLSVTFHIILLSYGKKETSLYLTSMQEGNALSAVHNCLFNTFTVTLHTWHPSPTYTHQGHAMLWQKSTTYWASTHFFRTSNFQGLWGHLSSGMWCSVTQRLAPDVSRQHGRIIFKGSKVPEEDPNCIVAKA